MMIIACHVDSATRGCHGQLACPCAASTGGQAASGTRLLIKTGLNSKLVACLLAGLTLALGMANEHAAAAPLAPLAPYKIRVLLALAPAPELTAAVERDLLSDLPGRAESLVGAAWELSAVPAPAALRADATAGIENVSAAAVLKESPDFDKVMLLLVEPSIAGYQVTARELDVRTQTWNAPVSRPARHLAKLHDAAIRALLAAFGPLGTIEAVEGQQVTVRLRASALPPRDPDIELLKPGDALRPVIRVNDAAGKGPQIARPAWTLLRVELFTPEKTRCCLECGLGSAELPAAAGRLESLAVGVARSDRGTKLLLQSGRQPPRRLAGYDVYRAEPDGRTAAPLGRSNRDGAVVIPPGPAAMEVLLVLAGAQPLARLPLVPGAETQRTVVLPDAAPLVEAEGLLRGIQEEIVDQVTLRETLIARAKARIETKRFDEAAAALRELKQLPTRDSLAQTLSAQRKRVAADDAALQQKIDNRFAETAKLLDRYLSAEPLRTLDEELKTAQGK